MIQAVISPEYRSELGIHYTSVPNIMKLIGPLFLDDLRQIFEKVKGNTKKLYQLLDRLSKIKIFDPACGSGNFLIISYKELRRLEINIIKHLEELRGSGQIELFSRIHLNQFYGIEQDDFAYEIAQLSLYLAQHQMNVEFEKEFGRTNPTLPLKEAGRIIKGNSCQIDWETVCPKNKEDELYILGNPPYHGARKQSKKQKEDMGVVFSVGFQKANNLDYIACWFKKGADYIYQCSAKLAFVTTNSICQGIQVPILWPYILEIKAEEIFFAHDSFKWSNEAKRNSGVYVMIIGIRNKIKSEKYIFQDENRLSVSNISPYITSGKNIYVKDRKKALSNLPQMTFGNMPCDDGNLLMNETEKNEILQADKNSAKYIKKFMGANEFIKGTQRYCLWITEKDFIDAIKNPHIKKRIDLVREFRLKSKREKTRKLANRPYSFGEIRHKCREPILIPRLGVGSERREYLPLKFYDQDTVISDSAQVVYNAEPYLFGILSSKIHLTWLKAVAGRLGIGIRYSIRGCYNTFPFPRISAQRKRDINHCVSNILEERGKYPEKTIAQLYDPDKMPRGLLEVHRANDRAVEKCYRSNLFESDKERSEFLFDLYEEMINEEKHKGELFEVQKKKI